MYLKKLYGISIQFFAINWLKIMQDYQLFSQIISNFVIFEHK